MKNIDPSTRNERVGYGMIHAQHALALADVAVRAADVGINEAGQVVVKVNNRGPADAQHVHVVAWRVPRVARVARWQFVRKGLGSYFLYDIGGSTLFEPIAFSSTATNPSPDPEVLCDFVSDAALGTLGEGYELLVVVDASNDHAFHEALMPLDSASRWLDARAPSLLRGYNNVAVVPRDQLGG